MSILRAIRAVFLVLTVVFVASCGVDPQKRAPATESEVAELTAMILNMGPGIDPAEAERAARVSFVHTRELAIAYEITDPPLVHNTKVNMGLRPRGLCWHWAEDMEKRLKAENFRTLEIHRAIASDDNPFRIDHSTSIISRKGDTYRDGVVLDPWREGGTLFYLPVLEDTHYNWRAQRVVLEEKYGDQAQRNRFAYAR